MQTVNCLITLSVITLSKENVFVITLWTDYFAALLTFPIGIVVEGVDGQDVAQDAVLALDGAHQTATLGRV
jgi:hypothetical protein